MSLLSQSRHEFRFPVSFRVRVPGTARRLLPSHSARDGAGALAGRHRAKAVLRSLRVITMSGQLNGGERASGRLIVH